MSGSESHDRLDSATSTRLAKLRTMPLDTSRVEANLRAQLPGRNEDSRRGLWPRIGAWRAVAAGILIVLLLGIGYVATASRPVRASADALAQVHHDLMAGQGALGQPISIEEANRQLAAGAGEKGPVALPVVSDCEVMACCKKSIGKKPMSCAMVEHEGRRLSMIVARASDVRASRDAATVMRGGVAYHVQSSGNLNMVMTDRNGRWLCVMGEEPTEKLIDTAAEMRF